MGSSIQRKHSGQHEVILDPDDTIPVGYHGDMVEEMWPTPGRLLVRWQTPKNHTVFADVTPTDFHACNVMLGRRQAGAMILDETNAVFAWRDGDPGYLVFYGVLNEKDRPVYRWVLPRP